MADKCKSYHEIVEKYGTPYNPYTQKIDNIYAEDFEHKWMTIFHFPDNFNPVHKIYCNRDIIMPLHDLVSKLHFAGLLNEIKTFDGCWNIRKVRGSETRWSIHTWGLAVDFNAQDNPLGGKSAWSKELIAICKEVGWVWGGDFSRSDPMHFEWTAF